MLLEEFSPNDWFWLVSYSGGKDSTLLLFSVSELTKRLGFAFGVVYNDSGGDLPELRALVYEVLDYVKSLGHEVYVTRPEMTFFDYLLTKYSPPRWNFRWCCKRLKELPFKKLAVELSKSRRILNLVGIRKEEARWRSWRVKRISDNLVYAAPLLDLSAEDVWSALAELASRNRFHAYVVEKLRSVYGNAERSGCWFCPLIAWDKLLQTRPDLLKLKYEILTAWCSGRREKIIELSEQHPELVKVTINKTTIDYPCGRRCQTCQVRIATDCLKALLPSI